MRNQRMLSIAAAAALLATATVVTCAQTRASATRGKDLAEQACAGCHAITSNEVRTIQGTVVPSFSTIASGPHGTTERLKSLITTPPHLMPAIPLTLNEIDDLAAFISSLK